MNGWIKCSMDNPPPEGERIQMGHWNSEDQRWYWIASGEIGDGVWWLDVTDDEFAPNYFHSVTHYKPLPSPPGEE